MTCVYYYIVMYKWSLSLEFLFLDMVHGVFVINICRVLMDFMKDWKEI